MHAAQSKSLCLAIFASFLGIPAHGQEIHIRVLDGRNGHPIARGCLNVWVGPTVGSTILETDKDGEVALRLVEEDASGSIRQYAAGCRGLAVVNPVFNYADTIRVAPVFYMACQARSPGLPGPTVSTEKVVKSGASTENKCGKIEVSPKPGELIVFVRPLTWLEWLRI